MPKSFHFFILLKKKIFCKHVSPIYINVTCSPLNTTINFALGEFKCTLHMQPSTDHESTVVQLYQLHQIQHFNYKTLQFSKISLFLAVIDFALVKTNSTFTHYKTNVSFKFHSLSQRILCTQWTIYFKQF